MIKTGIVISISNKKAGIMTNSGEFVYIKMSKPLPNVGEIYSGELYKRNRFNYKYALTAASLMFIFLSSGYAYAYYTPITTIVLSINPSVSLNANRWNKIISYKALNSDGSLILSNINLKNKSIDTALELLVKEAKTENFINNKYIDDKKVISVHIDSSKNESIDISNLKDIVDSSNLNMKIDTSSDNNKTIDLIVNNKKFNTSTLNSIINKKVTINKKLDTKTNINKSPKIKEKSKNTDEATIRRHNNIEKPLKSENKTIINNSSTINKYNSSSKVKDNIRLDKRNRNSQIPSNDDKNKNH